MKDMVEMILNPMMRRAPNGKISEKMLDAFLLGLPPRVKGPKGSGRTRYKLWASENWGVSLDSVVRAARKRGE